MSKRKGTIREKKPAVEQQKTLPETGAAAAGTDAVGEARSPEPDPADGAGQGDLAANGQAGDAPAQQGADGASEVLGIADDAEQAVEVGQAQQGTGAGSAGAGDTNDQAAADLEGGVGSGNDSAFEGSLITERPDGDVLGERTGNAHGASGGAGDVVGDGGNQGSDREDHGRDGGDDGGSEMNGGTVEEKAAIDAGDGSAGISEMPETPLSEIVPFAAEDEEVGWLTPENSTEPQVGNEAAKSWHDLFSSSSSSAPKADGYIDGSVYTASCAAFAVLDHIGELHELPDGVPERCDLLALGDDPEPANALAKYIRTIGRERATPAVLGQQLKILGLVDNGELHPVEQLIAKTFATTLCDLDDFDRQVAVWIEAAGTTSPQPVPVPIEDTTLEPVDDAFEATV